MRLVGKTVHESTAILIRKILEHRILAHSRVALHVNSDSKHRVRLTPRFIAVWGLVWSFGLVSAADNSKPFLL